MSDPRLEGTVTFVANEDIYHDGSGLEIGNSAISIENDEGVWRQRPNLFVGFPGQTEVSTEVEMLVLDGEGGYEGMVAVIEYLLAEDGGDDLHPQRLHGFIIDGAFPPDPENASTK